MEEYVRQDESVNHRSESERSSMHNSRSMEMEAGTEEEDEQWKRSPFAIGQTKSTWAEEDPGCAKLCSFCCSPVTSQSRSMYCTAFICSRLGANRVGNMVVLWQRKSSKESDQGKPRLRLVLGPYWLVALLATFPFIAVLSTLTFFKARLEENIAVLIPWSISTGALLLSFWKVATTDPGILYRYTVPPTSESGHQHDGDNGGNGDDEWIWNDQAHTFRPKHAKFDPEIQAVVSYYDHTCPWTGTAIGGGNMFWFRSFLCFMFTTLVLDAALVTSLN